jgi:Protein of unknown function (DUF3040)
MLSEAEQRRLAAIELQLRYEDPAYVRRFECRGQSGLPADRRNRLAVLVVLGAATVAGIGVVVDSVGAVVVALTAIAAVGIWVARR